MSQSQGSIAIPAKKNLRQISSFSLFFTRESVKSIAECDSENITKKNIFLLEHVHMKNL